MKIRPVGAEVYHVDRRTDTDRHNEANSSFSQFLRKRLKTKNETHRNVRRQSLVFTVL